MWATESHTASGASLEPAAVLTQASGADSDGDGILDSQEAPGDNDSDGLDNINDPDDDNDGIPTARELEASLLLGHQTQMATDSQLGMIQIQTTTVFAMKKREMWIRMEIRSLISRSG